MKLPDFLEGRASELIGIDMNAALTNEEAAQRRRYWAVILGLKPTLDGNRWCFLYGENLQEGVAGFGRSVVEAMIDFDRAIEEKQPA